MNMSLLQGTPEMHPRRIITENHWRPPMLSILQKIDLPVPDPTARRNNVRSVRPSRSISEWPANNTKITQKRCTKYFNGRKCRYCDAPLTDKNRSKTNIEAHMDICTNKECSELAKTACTKILGCGHPCSGVAGEKKCLPCLNEKCCEDNAELNGQTGDDYCNVCFIESLTASPCIRSACGHIFH